MPAPLAIRGLGKTAIDITWSDDHICHVTARTLRSRCRCAICIDEVTGEKRLDPTTIPADLSFKRIEQMGTYAIGVTFSDGHATGIFTFENLAGACSCSR